MPNSNSIDVNVAITENAVNFNIDENIVDVSMEENDVAVSITENEVDVAIEENVIEVEVLAQGASGAQVELQQGEEFLQWKYENEEEWRNLIAIDDFSNEPTIFACNSAVKVNDLVYFKNSILQISSSDDIATTPPIGIIREKPTATTAKIQRVGKRTGFSGLEVGKRYYLASDGQITANPPTSDGAVRVHIGIASTPNTLLLEFNNINLIN